MSRKGWSRFEAPEGIVVSPPKNEKTKRILVFGQPAAYDQYEHDLAEVAGRSVEWCDDPDYGMLDDLHKYEVVILDYSAFRLGDKILEDQADGFWRMLLYAAEGTWFCFLHYHETVPGDPIPGDRHLNRYTFDHLARFQLGLRILNAVDITARRAKHAFRGLDLGRTMRHFTEFLRQWGSSFNYFKQDFKGEFHQLICPGPGKGTAQAFALNAGRGKVLFLPFHLDFQRLEAMGDGLKQLIRSVINYKESSLAFPDWAAEPVFPGELKLYKKLKEAEDKAQKIKRDLQPFESLKQIIFAREYDFEDRVPQFISDQLNMKTRRDETFKEDFWLVDDDGKDIAIGECKTFDRAAKNTAVMSAEFHRAQNNKDSNFPAFTIVNANLRASSWDDKTTPIDHNICVLAQERKVLLLRIEDLVYFAYWIQEGKLKPEQLIHYICEKSGWLEVTKNGDLELHP